MKRLTTVCSVFLMVALVGFTPLAAQQRPDGQMPMGGQPGQPTPQPAVGGPQPSMMGPGMMGQGMMGMMCPMMGGMMGMPMMHEMMPPMMSGPTDPKSMGRLLQMRGEMLKAIGDILLKHGRTLEDGK